MLIVNLSFLARALDVLCDSVYEWASLGFFPEVMLSHS